MFDLTTTMLKQIAYGSKVLRHDNLPSVVCFCTSTSMTLLTERLALHFKPCVTGLTFVTSNHSISCSLRIYTFKGWRFSVITVTLINILLLIGLYSTDLASLVSGNLLVIAVL